MTSRKVHDVSANMCKKGFRKTETDHTKFHLYVDGKKTAIYTKISHGEVEIHETLIKAMARQLRLSKIQFLALVDCKIDGDDYLSILREKGDLPPADASEESEA